MNTNSRETETLTVLKRALDHAEEFLTGLENRPVLATDDLEELRAQIAIPLAEEGLPPEQVIDELVAAVDGGLLGSTMITNF